MNLHHYLFLVFIAGITACSTAKPVGVRTDFQKMSVKKIGIMAVFSTGKFSLEEQEFEKLRATYAKTLKDELSLLEFQVTDRKIIEAPYSERERLALEDGLGLPKSLEILFEADQGEFGAEVATIRNFHSRKNFPDHILFAEIVYHSETICQESAKQYNAYAQINDSKIKLPTDCILAHFQAKLVDAKTGKPMWSNHVFLEHRLGSKQSSESTKVIRSVVKKTLAGENGIVHLR